MNRLDEMLKNEAYDEIWDKYCGFLDLNLDEFMAIQERLLMEQIEILSKSGLGKKIMGDGVKPSTIEEFRRVVPLTKYEDYADILLSKNEDMLPSKPKYWIQTTWKGGTHEYKYAPYSENMIKEHARAFTASLILASSTKRGEVKIKEKDKFLYGMAPLPYLTGLAPYGLSNEIDFEYLPDIEAAEKMGFEERNSEGFKLAMDRGIDYFFGLSSVLVKIGEDFVKGASQGDSKARPKNIKMMGKLLKAKYKKEVKKENILPKDIWDIKGIICAGTDSHAFKEKIQHYWGTEPLEIYGGTEIGTVATESWGGGGLTFYPDSNFYEFIPEKESLMSIMDSSYQPKTLLLNELKAGERYEIVTTKFRGGAFVRYRVGDMIECLALNDEKNGIKLPQIRFVDRISNVIDIAGFTRITEATIQNAIDIGGVKIENWIACKEYHNNYPSLNIYAEIHKGDDVNNVKEILQENLKKFDQDIKDLEDMLGFDCLRLTPIEVGSIEREFKDSVVLCKMNPDKESLKRLLSA